jgi:hypothetical protein
MVVDQHDHRPGRRNGDPPRIGVVGLDVERRRPSRDGEGEGPVGGAAVAPDDRAGQIPGGQPGADDRSTVLVPEGTHDQLVGPGRGTDGHDQPERQG